MLRVDHLQCYHNIINSDFSDLGGGKQSITPAKLPMSLQNKIIIIVKGIDSEIKVSIKILSMVEDEISVKTISFLYKPDVLLTVLSLQTL